jgi:hypothetical protein
LHRPPRSVTIERMRKQARRVLFLVLTTFTGAGVFLGVWWSAHAHTITAENVAHIQPGMTRTEVVDLLGMPGSYDGAVFVSLTSTMVFADDPDLWVSRHAAVKVFFDDEQRVTLVVHGYPAVNEGWVARCLRWFGI